MTKTAADYIAEARAVLASKGDRAEIMGRALALLEVAERAAGAWDTDALARALAVTDDGIERHLRRLDSISRMAIASHDRVLVATVDSARDDLRSLLTSQRQQIALVRSGAGRPACARDNDSPDRQLPPTGDRSGVTEGEARTPGVSLSACLFDDGYGVTA